jgi:hypothetical protein
MYSERLQSNNFVIVLKISVMLTEWTGLIRIKDEIVLKLNFFNANILKPMTNSYSIQLRYLYCERSTKDFYFFGRIIVKILKVQLKQWKIME